MNPSPQNSTGQNPPFRGQGVIEHGIPLQKYFAIAQPPSVSKPTTDALDPEYVKPVLELKDPKTGQLFKAEVNGHWTFTTDELLQHEEFCLLVYGISAHKLVKHLCRQYPEIEQTKKVRFILLKKI